MLSGVFYTNFFWIFLFVYTVHEVVHVVLEILNYRHARAQTEIPVYFQDKITQETFEKSRQYTLEKTSFSLVSHFVTLPFFWLLIFCDGFNLLQALSVFLGGSHGLWVSVIFCLLIGLYFFIVELPVKLYSIFVIEARYGFNRMTPKLFLIDLVKSLLLSLSLGVPLLLTVFWFMRESGSFWWLWVFLALFVFQLLIIAVYPTFLAPLFNKFKPLEDLNLKEKIFSLAEKIHFKLSGVFVIDGSKRSSHSNAYFAGLGRWRRIVLFDTLMQQLTTDELVSVLAHEMGHNVKKHIQMMLVINGLYLLSGFYIMSLVIGWPEFYQAFNVLVPSTHAALVLFFLVYETFTFFITPMLNYLSRKNEFEADAFAVAMTENKEATKSGLIKLTKENLSNLTPHPVYSFYHYSHPTITERLKAIDARGV